MLQRPRRRLRHRLAAAVAAAVAAVPLAACSGSTTSLLPDTAVPAPVLPSTVVGPTTPTTPTAAPTPAAAPPVPTVGECWTKLDDALSRAASNPGPSTPCAGGHLLETVKVLPLTGADAQGATPPGEATALFSRLAGGTCSATVSAATQPGKEKPWATTVRAVAYVPTAAEWTAGARWVRCDAAVLGFAKVDGGAESGRRFAARSGLLAAADRAVPALRLCGTRGKGKDDPVQYLLSCNVGHNAEFTHSFDLGGPTVPYPGVDKLTMRMTDICRSRISMHTTPAQAKLGAFISAPDQAGWQAGDHIGQCLLNVAEKSRGVVLK